MKKQIINYLVLIVIALVANYPVYRDLQASVKVAQSTIAEVNKTLIKVKSDIIKWKKEVDVIQSRVNVMGDDFTTLIDGTLNKTDNIMLKIQSLENHDLYLQSKIDSVKATAMKEVKAKVRQSIPGLPGF